MKFISKLFQVRKLQDKVSKSATSVKKTKEEYELALLDINNYNSRYMEVNTYFNPPL